MSPASGDDGLEAPAAEDPFGLSVCVLSHMPAGEEHMQPTSVTCGIPSEGARGSSTPPQHGRNFSGPAASETLPSSPASLSPPRSGQFVIGQLAPPLCFTGVLPEKSRAN